jgi:putative transposase
MLDFMPFQERTVQDYGILLNHIYYYDDALRRWICSTDPDDASKARKFVVRYIPRDMSTVYFWDPDDESYIDIPYRDRSHPPASYWEIEAAVQRLHERGQSHVNEDLIFEALAEMRTIEEEAERLTKRARREREKRNHPPKMPAKVGPKASSTTPPVTSGAAPQADEPIDDDEVVVQPFDGIVEPD